MELKKLIATLTGSDYSQPSEKALEYFKNLYGQLFDKIGYIRENIQPFEAILEFMARYKIATLTEEKAEKSPNEVFKKLYESEMKGKKYRLPRGLLFLGGCGTGKTLAAKIIKNTFDLELFDTYHISFQYQKKDGNDWLEKWVYENSTKTLVIDDLGAEGDIKKYGNESPMGAIISTRAKFWEDFGTPTIYTTNAGTPEELAKKYSSDIRLADRLSTYPIAVNFTGQSRRK